MKEEVEIVFGSSRHYFCETVVGKTFDRLPAVVKPGDRLFLYTDGLLEAANATGEEFGPHRLSALLKEGARLNPEAAADHIISSLQTWSKSQNDDLTVLICDYAGFQAA